MTTPAGGPDAARDLLTRAFAPPDAARLPPERAFAPPDAPAGGPDAARDLPARVFAPPDAARLPPERAFAPPDAPAEAPDWSRVRRLLVLRLDNLGDIVLTGPALRAIKAALPGVHLTLLASPGGAPAAALLPWVDDLQVARVLWQDLGRLALDPARERALLDHLRRGAYDAALILTSFSQSPHPAAFACALAGIPRRIGASRERGRALTHALARPPDDVHQAERNLRLVEAAGLPVHDRQLEIRLPPAARRAARARVAPGYLLLNPFASCQARTFDPLALARAARIVGERTGLRVVVCGAARDRPRAAPLADLLGPCGLDLVGATDLPTFAALIAGARLVLTGNTSALHLADALRVPQLVLYAGTDLTTQWAPRAAPHRLLQRPAPCSPCYLFDCPHGHRCLAYTPEQIAAACLRLLADTEPAARVERRATMRPLADRPVAPMVPRGSCMKTILGLFQEFTPAHEAVGLLINQGHGQSDISLIGNDVARERAEQVEQDPDPGPDAQVTRGSGMLGLLDAFGELELPGVGPLIVAGPLLGFLSGAVAATDDGTGGLVRALQQAGVPEADAARHAAAIAGGATLVLVRTADALAAPVVATLAAHGAATSPDDVPVAP